jgi:ADP-ribosyl-[dinitrogen reductase] hydrolase
MTLTTAQLDRAVGVLLGTAAGDALGAAYELRRTAVGRIDETRLDSSADSNGPFRWCSQTFSASRRSRPTCEDRSLTDTHGLSR